MEIKEIQNKEVWEEFLSNCEEKTFLQSWNWGEFNNLMGNKLWRLGIYDSDELISTVLVTKIIAKRGTLLLIQHGPNTISNFKFQILNTLLEELKRIGKEEEANFIRIAPLWERNEENQKIFKDLGFRKAPMHANAYEATWKLDIRPSEEKLFGQMRKTTRYLIRQAVRNQEIEIYQSPRIDDIEIFDELQQQVKTAQKFVPFSLDYLKNEFLAFQLDNQISIFLGKYKGEIVAAAIIIFWSNIGFYHHASLSPRHHKIPIAYLLQWEAIKEAKKRECVLYDFWGYVNPQIRPKHPWAGPTLFKMGFGGNQREYIKTQDFPLSRKYWMTFVFEKLRKVKRRL